MKKIYILLAMTLFVMAGTLNAQKMYARLGIGGGVGLKLYDGTEWCNETVTTTADNIEIKSMGLGSGLNAGIAFGYMLTDNIGVELGVNEYIGIAKKTTYTNNSIEASITRKGSGMMLQLVPAITLTPALGKINPYARIGMIVGILPSAKVKQNSTSEMGEELKTTATEEYDYKDYGGVAVGFTAAAGAIYQLSERINLFAELIFNGITYSPTKGKVKTWTVDGIDQLPYKTTKEKEWTYEKKYNSDEVIPDTSPDKKDKDTYEFSDVLLNIGIRINL